MTQQTDTEALISKAGLATANGTSTPYRSSHPVDAVPGIDLPLHEREAPNKLMQELVGSMNWLSTQTRPDITTITAILTQYNHSCSPGHIDSAKYAIHYLIDSAGMGIKFSSKADHDLESFVKFPIDPSQLTPLTDAN